MHRKRPECEFQVRQDWLLDILLRVTGRSVELKQFQSKPGKIIRQRSIRIDILFAGSMLLGKRCR